MIDKQQLSALGGHMAEQQAKADRAMEIFEQKSPHQLAVELVAMQDRCDAVAAEFSENARQCGAMAELLGELRPCLVDAWASDGHASRHDQYHNELLGRIDALLAGEVPGPAAAAAKKPRITGVNGVDAEFSVKFPNGLGGEPDILFHSLCFDEAGISGGQHICAMLAAANWLIDRAEWYKKGVAIINHPYVWIDAAQKQKGGE